MKSFFIENLGRRFKRSRGQRSSAVTPGAVVPAMSSRQNSGNEGESLHNAANQECDSILERLSPEIRRCLLSILDLPRMKALVHASPVFHQQYLLDRRYLLCASLGTTLQSVLHDAHAVRQSEKYKTTDQFVGILETWMRPSTKPSPRELTVNTTEEDAVHLVSRHLQTIVPIAGYFANWALDEISRQTGEYEEGDNRREPRSQPALSKTEWLRCLRATYRFQLLCNVASPSIPGLNHSHTSNNAELLFNKLKPWEVEELFSFYQFATAVYDEIFSRIEPELRPDNPRFADQRRPPTPEGAFELDDEWTRHNFLEGTVLQGGLDLLYTVLFDVRPDDQERLIGLMQRSMVSSYIPINAVEGILGESQQSARRSERSAPEDRMTEDRTPLPFTRDDLDEPPLAWTLIWGGTYSNLYGWYTPDEMRRWAYVFWDAERMDKCGGRDLVNRQWGEYWPGGDPRDNLW